LASKAQPAYKAQLLGKAHMDLKAPRGSKVRMDERMARKPPRVKNVTREKMAPKVRLARKA
jgi:hypothetical protein